MRYLKRFETYSIAEDKPIQTQVDGIVKNIVVNLPKDVKLGVSDYVKCLKDVFVNDKFDLLSYINTNRALRDKPYKLDIDTPFVKELTTEETVDENPEIYMKKLKNSKKLLTSFSEDKNVLLAKEVTEIIQQYQDKKDQKFVTDVFNATCFIVFTYTKIRAIFKEVKEEQKPSVFKRLTTTLATTAVKVAGSITSLVLPVASFFSQGSDATGCFRACQKMVGAPAPLNLGIKMVKETPSGLVKLSTFSKGVETIDKHLADGKPIIVGVDDKKGSVNHDETTDHFVVIVSSGKDATGMFYRFFDPGTSHVEKGTNENNKFYEKDGFLVGTSAYNKMSKTYTMSWVRPT